MKVFIADDSELLRDRLKSMLSEIPRVEIIGEAATGIETSEGIRRLKPDIIVLDIRMSQGNGFDVLKGLARNEASRVIVLTNYSQSGYRDRSLAAGARYFFDKSSEFDRVREVIANWVNDSGGCHCAAL